MKLLKKVWNEIGFTSWNEFAMFVGVLAFIAMTVEYMAQSI